MGNASWLRNKGDRAMTDRSDDFYEEIIHNITTYSGGGKSCHIDKISTSLYEYPSRTQKDGSIVPVALAVELTMERLIIGTDAKHSFIHFEIKHFKKHPAAECWVLNPGQGYYGISFTPETMKKIAKIIEEF